MDKTKKQLAIRKGFHITPLGETPYLQSFSVDDIMSEHGVKISNKKWKEICKDRYIKCSKSNHTPLEHKTYIRWMELSEYQNDYLKVHFEDNKMYLSFYHRGDTNSDTHEMFRYLSRIYNGEYVVLEYNGETNSSLNEVRWEIKPETSLDAIKNDIKEITKYLKTKTILQGAAA